jgi:hypothetical protein
VAWTRCASSTPKARTAPAPPRLEEDLVNQKVALYNFQANVLTLKAEGSMVGSLLDCTA